MPGIEGRGNILDLVVCLAEEVKVPRLVYALNVTVLVAEVLMECSYAMLTTASRLPASVCVRPMVDLVIYLQPMIPSSFSNSLASFSAIFALYSI